MKALSVKQPFANWLVEGIKGREHRSRSTHFRGYVAIHASKIPDKKFMDEWGLNDWQFICGCIIGLVKIYDVEDYGNGMFAWKTNFPIQLGNPIPCKGMLGFWDVPGEIEQKLRGYLK